MSRVWNLHIGGYRYGGDIAKWLSDYLEQDNLDLVGFAGDLEPRKSSLVDEKSNNARDFDEMIYNDYSPYMLISENSLEDLNSRLKNKVTMGNFRPSLVAKDVSIPYAEVFIIH